MKYVGTKEECVKIFLFTLFTILGGLFQFARELLGIFFRVAHFVTDRQKVTLPIVSIALFFLYVPATPVSPWSALVALSYVLVTWVFFFSVYVLLGVVATILYVVDNPDL
jgi:hypothetical protein